MSYSDGAVDLAQASRADTVDMSQGRYISGVVHSMPFSVQGGTDVWFLLAQSYIFKVLKEIHPDESISQKAMAIMDTFAADMFNRITAEAARLCRHTNKQTMSSREVGPTTLNLYAHHDPNLFLPAEQHGAQLLTLTLTLATLHGSSLL